MLRILKVLFLLGLLVFSGNGRASAEPRFKAVAFDYFVIFNPDSVIEVVNNVLPGRGSELVRIWRTKQFEYGFLRSITGRHADFFEVTGDALDYATAALGIVVTSDQRRALLEAYLKLKPWPDAVAALKTLRAAGLKIITIANFSEVMLRANADNAGITGLFDVLLSTERNATFKPDPRAYELGATTLKLKKDEIVFAAFGGWDAYGAKSYGYPTYWVNRFGLPVERLGLTADRTSRDLAGLLSFVLEAPTADSPRPK